jgi:hypothetical protein
MRIACSGFYDHVLDRVFCGFAPGLPDTIDDYSISYPAAD